MEVEIMILAKELLANPLTRARIVYPGTGRVNLPALRVELRNRKFAESAVREMEVPAVLGHHNKNGWHGTRTASPGRASGARKDPENGPWADRAWDARSSLHAKGRMGR